MTPWTVPGLGRGRPNGISMDLSVGGVCISLSSSDNTGFSVVPNAEQGFDVDFSSFTGKLRIIQPSITHEQVIIQDIPELTETFVDAMDSVEAENGEEDDQRSDPVEQQDLCARAEAILRQSDDDNASQSAREETELHFACARPNVSMKELYMILRARPEAASLVDEQGRYPLHVFSENAPLLASVVDYPKETQRFVVALFDTYPEALFLKDVNGNVPFASLIQEWIKHEYGIESSTGVLLDAIVTIATAAGSKKERTPYGDVVPQVEITHAVMTVFKILSTYLNRINDCRSPRASQLIVRAALAEQIASIPCLLKTIYLIEMDEARQEMIHFGIIQRASYCCESCGEWVSNMLRHGDVPSKRAVDYLADVSNVTATQYAGQTPTAEDVEAFEQDRKQLFVSLESSGQLVQSLTVLKEDEKGRAATTDAVWTIINNSISRPLVIGFQTADFVFNVLLLLTFRYATDTNNLILATADNALTDSQSDSWVVSLSLYFLIRKLSESYAIFCISASAFKSYNMDLWNLIDLSGSILVTVAVLTGIDNGAFLALTMALLWLKFLSWMKGVNTQLALFILAVVEVSYWNAHVSVLSRPSL